MTRTYDLVVAGGGPAGSAAAWRAARSGARVVVVDKAEFPRDKPCGDGLTPRAVSHIQKMGLADTVARFHRVRGARIFSPGEWELGFPRRPGMPDHGHVARRCQLDGLLLGAAAAAGAEIRQGAEVCAPIVDDGRVTGVELKGGERLTAGAVVAADGAYSPTRRALNLTSPYTNYAAVAIRAEMGVDAPDGDTLDIHLKLEFDGDQLPGYGWVFPLGGGRANIGLGYATSYRRWHEINAARLLGEFMARLPAQWRLPSVEELKRSRALQAWRLPMGFSAWPPWRPGILFAGDALGAARPVSGAGISKALQSGMAAGECAVAALANGGPDDFTNYTQQIRQAWGREYRRGRLFHRVVGIPAVAGAGVKVLDTVAHPGLRSHLLFWESWGGAR